MKKEIINKRLIIGGIVISTLFIGIMFRLIYIQIYKHEEYSYLALKQRGTEIEINSPRGYIYDKKLRPITNNTSIPTMIAPKDLVSEDEVLFSKILENSDLTYSELKDLVNNEDLVLQIPLNNTFNVEDYNNVFIVDIINRYEADNPLSHVIGYVNKIDNSGKYGLEKSYNEFLEHSSKNSIFLEYDDKKSFLIGATEFASEDTTPMDPTSIVTTVDLDIQKGVEYIMDEHKINGSVIVTEVDTGNISAIASRPNFNQDGIHYYSDNTDMTLYNRAIQVGYPPGSIFKVVVLLAALEDNPDIIYKEFNCNGYEYVEDIRISCSSVHNNLNLKEAISKSCNSTFIQIGKELGSEKILDMARRLNFGDKINIGLLEEIPGGLPNREESIGPAIGNISIGQGKIEATPLQIANLMMIIANDGIQRPLKLVEGISNDDGDIIHESRVEEEKKVVEKEYAEILSEYLIDVVENGTGRGIDLDDYGSAGGKTGSAEAMLRSKQTIHGWFAGFYPAYNPKYVITVLVEDGISGSRSAAPIFEEICINLSKTK